MHHVHNTTCGLVLLLVVLFAGRLTGSPENTDTRTTGPADPQWLAQSYDYDFGYDYEEETSDDWGLLSEPWFYFVFICVLGLLVCLFKACKVASRTDSDGATNPVGISAQTPATNGHLSSDVPSAPSMPANTYDYTPPDYNTISAQYKPTVQQGFNTNPYVENTNPSNVNGTFAYNVNSEAFSEAQNTFTPVNFNNGMNQGLPNGVNENDILLTENHPEPLPPACDRDNTGSVNQDFNSSPSIAPSIGTSSTLPPPPSYEDALNYERWHH